MTETHAAESQGDTEHISLDPAGRMWKTALVVAAYAVLGFAFFNQVWSHPSTTMQLGGDQFNFVWLLQSTANALSGLHNPFYSDHLNYPFGVNLVANAGVVGLGTIFAPITWIFGPVASFNTVETLSLTASAFGGYFFVLRWVSWRPAAFVGGLLYGFSPYVIAQTGHINLTFVVLPPLILLMVHEIVVRQTWTSRRSGVVLALLCVAQFFISSELLFDTVLIGAIAVACVAIAARSEIASHARTALHSLGWATGVGVVLLAYPIWFALRGPAHINGLIQNIPQAYRANLPGPVVPDSRLLLAPSHFARIADHFASSTAENGSYLGITLLLVLLAGTILLWRVRAVRVAAIVGTAAFVLSLGAGLVVRDEPSLNGSGVPLPGWILFKTPLLENAIPARYALFSALFAALILGIVLDRLRRRLLSRGRSFPWLAWTAPIGLAAFALFPLIPEPLAGVGPVDLPLYFSSSAVRHIPEGSVAVLYPYPSSDHQSAQLWQAATGIGFRQPGTVPPLAVPNATNGHVAYTRALGFGRVTVTSATLIGMAGGHIPPETSAVRSSLLAQFRSWHVQSLVAVPAGTPDPAGAIAFFSWLFGRQPVITPGSETTYAWYRLSR
ncbi:MAG: hypothetical protein WAL61_00915 [Acidimicrobiales bacterium]